MDKGDGMKILNQPVAVVALFSNQGNVEPLAFKYHGKEYRVRMVKWWKFGDSLWAGKPSRIYCVSTQDEKIAELKWIAGTEEWVLVKLD